MQITKLIPQKDQDIVFGYIHELTKKIQNAYMPIALQCLCLKLYFQPECFTKHGFDLKVLDFEGLANNLVVTTSSKHEETVYGNYEISKANDRNYTKFTWTIKFEADVMNLGIEASNRSWCNINYTHQQSLLKYCLFENISCFYGFRINKSARNSYLISTHEFDGVDYVFKQRKWIVNADVSKIFTLSFDVKSKRLKLYHKYHRLVIRNVRMDTKLYRLAVSLQALHDSGYVQLLNFAKE